MKHCLVDGCEGRHHGHGYCQSHYDRTYRPTAPVMVVRQRPCTVDGCQRPHMAKGYCSGHYQRLRRGQDMSDMPPRTFLPRSEVVRLRRAVGLPDDGPTEALRARWAREEATW